MMRPSVAGPTGTEIGAPVLVTFMPRRRPSEEPSAMRAHDAVAELLLDFEGQAFLGQRVASARPRASARRRPCGMLVARELDVDHRADALDDRALCLCHSFPA